MDIYLLFNYDDLCYIMIISMATCYKKEYSYTQLSDKTLHLWFRKNEMNLSHIYF